MADGTSQTQAVAKQNSDADKFKNMSIEAIIKLMIMEKADRVRSDMLKMSEELKTRQDKVHWIHTLIKKINSRIDKDSGELDITDENAKTEEEKRLCKEIREMLEKASEEKGYDIKYATKYNKEERERLLDNLRTTVEDLNVQNDMQIQDLSQLVTERYEVFQMARGIIKPLHDDKMQKIRAMSGR